MIARRAGLACMVMSTLAASAAELPSTRDLANLSLEELANVEITSVSKKAERLSDAPASVFVITAQDIRRSGATSLAEVLRLAPNLQVAQATVNSYGMRARGVYNTSADKLLVLIDGRSVYTPLYAGVFWDVQEVMLEDIERIEVVSGAGGTLWGVNAVNGVINVITRPAQATQGALLAAGAGNTESNGAVRYGGTAGANGHYRVYGKYIDRAHSETATGTPITDASHLGLAGFRADWVFGRDRVSVHGNAYQGAIGQPYPGTVSISGIDLAIAAIPVSGVNLTGAWTRRGDDGSEVSVQAYFDRTERDVVPTFAEKLDLFDVQFQQALWPESRVSFIWGGEYRLGRDRLVNSDVFGFLPAAVDQRWGSLFAQGEARITSTVEVTAGVRMEHNDYTGTEWLPNVRVGWKPSADDLLWGAVSRTVRAPSRLDRDAFVPSKPPFLLAGGPDVRAEVANVVELGYRGSRHGRLSYSITVFRAEYDHLHTQEIAPSRTFLVFASNLEATAYGVEMWGTLQATERWRLSAGYFGEREEFRLKPGSNDAAAVGGAARDPAYQWLVRSSHNLARGVELDATVRAVAALGKPTVPGYVTADLRLGWKPTPSLELFIAARNLADGGHGEFSSELTRTEFGRSAYAGFRWQFGAR